MSQTFLPPWGVGNEFILPKPKIKVAAPVVIHKPAVVAAAPALDNVELAFEKQPRKARHLFTYPLELFHRYSVGAFALLFLIVGGSAIQVGGAYQSAQITIANTAITSALRVPAQPLRGPNMAVSTADLVASLQRVTSQPLSLTVGEHAVPLSPETIKSWLQIVANQKEGVAYIHVNEAAISKSLNEAAAPYVKTAHDQVSVTYADGTSRVIVAGRSGTKLGDTGPASKQIASGLLAAKGLQANIPIETLGFATLTPANFDKLIEVNVNSKQMWMYDKGTLARQYPISAGAPSTPTPIGQFKIYSKPAIQDMRGFNADGSKYFQANVRWINYFLPGGYAVHGNYWRPLSWFGAVNSSHGCVSLPEDQAKWVYDWAPIGTTVIVHY